MNRSKFALTCILVGAPISLGCAVGQKQFREAYVTQATGIPLYTEPSQNSRQVLRIPYSTELNVLAGESEPAYASTWFRVSANGVEGWIRKYDVSNFPPPSADFNTLRTALSGNTFYVELPEQISRIEFDQNGNLKLFELFHGQSNHIQNAYVKNRLKFAFTQTFCAFDGVDSYNCGDYGYIIGEFFLKSGIPFVTYTTVEDNIAPHTREAQLFSRFPRDYQPFK